MISHSISHLLSSDLHELMRELSDLDQDEVGKLVFGSSVGLNNRGLNNLSGMDSDWIFNPCSMNSLLLPHQPITITPLPKVLEFLEKTNQIRLVQGLIRSGQGAGTRGATTASLVRERHFSSTLFHLSASLSLSLFSRINHYQSGLISIMYESCLKTCRQPRVSRYLL